MAFDIKKTGAWKRDREDKRIRILNILKKEGWTTLNRIAILSGITRKVSIKLLEELIEDKRATKYYKHYNTYENRVQTTT